MSDCTWHGYHYSGEFFFVIHPLSILHSSSNSTSITYWKQSSTTQYFTLSVFYSPTLTSSLTVSLAALHFSWRCCPSPLPLRTKTNIYNIHIIFPTASHYTYTHARAPESHIPCYNFRILPSSSFSHPIRSSSHSPSCCKAYPCLLFNPFLLHSRHIITLSPAPAASIAWPSRCSTYAGSCNVVHGITKRLFPTQPCLRCFEMDNMSPLKCAFLQFSTFDIPDMPRRYSSKSTPNIETTLHPRTSIPTPPHCSNASALQYFTRSYVENASVICGKVVPRSLRPLIFLTQL